MHQTTMTAAPSNIYVMGTWGEQRASKATTDLLGGGERKLTGGGRGSLGVSLLGWGKVLGKDRTGWAATAWSPGGQAASVGAQSGLGKTGKLRLMARSCAHGP